MGDELRGRAARRRADVGAHCQVTSADAIILELLQTDMEEALDDDPELEQSVGRLRQDILVAVAPAAADALAVLWLHLGRARTSN